MKKILISYYLIPFIGFLVLFLLKGLMSEYVNSLIDNLFTALMFSTVLTIITGTLYYLYDTKWGPKTRTKILSKSPFKELRENGFQKYEEIIWGLIDGYTVLVSFEWFTGKSAINIQVLFNPKSYGHFLTLQETKEIHKRHKSYNLFKSNEYEWQTNLIGFLMEYTFKPPSYEKVLSKASEMIDILNKENLNPISNEETLEVLNELEEWLKTNKG